MCDLAHNEHPNCLLFGTLLVNEYVPKKDLAKTFLYFVFRRVEPKSSIFLLLRQSMSRCTRKRSSKKSASRKQHQPKHSSGSSSFVFPGLVNLHLSLGFPLPSPPAESHEYLLIDPPTHRPPSTTTAVVFQQFQFHFGIRVLFFRAGFPGVSVVFICSPPSARGTRTHNSSRAQHRPQHRATTIIVCTWYGIPGVMHGRARASKRV